MNDQQADGLWGKLERIAVALERIDRRMDLRNEKLSKIDEAVTEACSAIGRIATALEIERPPSAQVVRR